MVKKEWGWMFFNDAWNMKPKETKGNDIPHSDIRRMESEGVKKKNSDGISQTLSDDDECHTLDVVLNDMVKDWDTTLSDGLDDDDIYEDGIDERPGSNKSDNYNDDEFDY